MPVDLAVLLSAQHRVRGQFGVVVAEDRTRVALLFGNPVQFAESWCLESKVSTAVARHSRLKSSITHQMRQHARFSAKESKLQRWFGFSGMAIGAWVPSVRLRPPRSRTARQFEICGGFEGHIVRSFGL